MLSNFQFRRGSVSRVLGISALIAVLFVAGCTSSGKSAQFAVMTTSASLPTGSISTGAAYPSTTLTASAGTAPYTWTVTTGSLPTGLTLSLGGVISGTPTASGTFPFTVTATDSATPAHTATASLSITINAKLTITSAGTLSTVGAAGSAYTGSLSATGGVGPFTWAVNSGNLPTGLGLSGTTGTGTISGTISSSAAPGSYNFTAKITDSQGGVGISGTITITVDAAVAVTPPTFPVGVVGLNFTSPAFAATGGSGTGYTFAIASGSIAPLVLNANTGIISGIPTTAATLQFSVKVTDSSGFTATSSGLSITINAAITVTLSPASPVTLDQTKTQLVTATVTNDPNSAGVNWSAVTGLGSLTGSTTTAATYNAPATVSAASTATFTATSKTDPTKSATYTINLVPPPQITTTTMAAGNVNGAYSAPVNMSGGVAPFTWAIVAGPTGLTLSSSTTSTVNVQGTPTVAGANQTFTIKVTDAQGLSVTSIGLTITVYPTLTITPPVLPIGVATLSYSSPAFTATGGSGSGYTFAVASGSVAPLAIGSATGIISGTPTTATTLHFTVKVTDSVGNVATTGALSITINPAITVTFSPTGPVTLDQAKTQLVTATVTNDPNSAGVNWSAVTGLGTLTGQTITSATYNAPATVAVASTATFTATSVTDPTKSATFTVNLVPPPQITTTIMAAGNVNGPYSSPVSESGGVAPYTWAIVAAPTGLTLSSSTASTVTVQGAPTVAGPNQTFTIKVTDAQGLSVNSGGLTITVYAALVLTPPSLPLPVGAVGVNYPTTETFTASGGSGAGYTWSIVAGNPLPTGLALNSAAGASTSITAGPPTVAGTYPFTVKVTDSVNNAATTSGLSIVINPPISVALSPALPFTMDQNTTQLITATVTNDPGSAGVTWSAVTGLGTLTGPTSTTITFNAPATITTPSISTFTATSVTDPTKSATFSVSLEPPPVIATPTFPAGTVGASYSSPVTSSGGVGPYTWSFTALPAGLSLSSSTTNTVNVTGTPTTAGASQTVTIKVTDAKGLSNTLNSTITINTASCVSNCTISGNVSGPWFEGVTITLSGGPSSPAPAKTDSSGNYSFTGLSAGSYTVTPSLPGYTYSPSAPSVAASLTTMQNFTATSVIASHSISGVVSYPTGAEIGKTFNTIIRVYNSGCTNCGGSTAGTSISSIPAVAGTAYIVRGLSSGSYIVTAEIDTQLTGVPNSSNPNGISATATINTTDVTGVNITVADRTPLAPSAPSTPNIFPASGAVLVVYNEIDDTNGEELATSYKLSYGTDTNATNLGTKTYPAGNSEDVFALTGLTNGTAYYFKLAAVNATATSAYSSVVGPITVNATSGANTVSGTVTFTGITPAGGAHLNVGLFSGVSGVYFVSYPTPTSGQTFSISGVPSGKYSLFAFLDQVNCNYICVGDVTNFVGPNGPPQIVISGPSTGNAIALTAFNANTYVSTYHASGNGNPDSYGVNVGINLGLELPISMTLYSAPGVGVPYDLNADPQNSNSPINNNSVSPTVGDIYNFQVTFANGTTQVIPASVTEVLNTFATSLSETTSGVVGGVTLSRNVPEFTWAAPSSPPSVYTYQIQVYDDNQQIWNYKGGSDGNGLPSTVTSAVYNSDGKASQSTLTTGVKYAFSVSVTDTLGNTASFTVSYTP